MVTSYIGLNTNTFLITVVLFLQQHFNSFLVYNITNPFSIVVKPTLPCLGK